MKKQAPSPIFIVGNSRSGTTLMSKILGRNPEIHSLKEIHFFEQMWNPADPKTHLDRPATVKLTATLLGHAREGRELHQSPDKYLKEAGQIIASLKESPMHSPPEIYKVFLEYEARHNDKSIPCEQTPRYIFYLKEILELFPDARIIVMLRDPRDILLSQKNKWRSYTRGNKVNQLCALLRVWMNYHPILLSQMWKRAMSEALHFRDDPRVKFIHFENLVSVPEQVAREICDFAGIAFQNNMLEVAGSESPLARQEKTTGISTTPIGRWRKQLPEVDTYWCNRIAGQHMNVLNYKTENSLANPIAIAWSAAIFPVKASLALILNLTESRNVIGSIRRRLFG
ncbi:MAG: sulfotransferase [Candidatus Sedimenticola sp. 6PFRAG7]